MHWISSIYSKRAMGLLKLLKQLSQIWFFSMNLRLSCIYECQKRIVEYYEKEQYTLDRDYEFYSLDIIEDFINKAAQRCIEILL